MYETLPKQLYNMFFSRITRIVPSFASGSSLGWFVNPFNMTSIVSDNFLAN